MPDKSNAQSAPLLSNRGIEFLKARGISDDTAMKFDLFTARGPDGKDAAPTLDDTANYLAIPSKQGDKVLYTQFRDMRPGVSHKFRYLSPKEAKPAIFNVDCIADPGLQDVPLKIFGGALDAIAATQCKAQRCISLPGDGQTALIKEIAEDLEQVREIIIASDGDESGDDMRAKLLEILGEARCRSISYPAGCKDVGEVLQHKGPHEVRKCFLDAAWVPMAGLFSLDQLPDEAAEPPPLKIRAFGADVENLIGIRAGDLSFWTGQPGGGKTTLVRGLSWALAAEHGVKTSAAFFEDKPRRDTVRNLKKLWANGWPEGDQIAEAEDFIRSNFWFIRNYKRRTFPTLDWFLDQAEAAVIRHGCKLIIADPWSRFRVRPKNGEDKLDAILDGICELKEFAEDFNVHVAVIAHPRKPSTYGGTDQMADGYDISGSKDFFDLCDLGVTVQADPHVKYLTNAKVWKVRDREEMGDRGEFSLHLSPHSKRFAQLHPDDAKALRERHMQNIVEFTPKRRNRRQEPARQYWQENDR